MEVHWVHLQGELNEETQQAIESRLQKLAEGHADLREVRIAAQSTPHHRRGAKGIRVVGMLGAEAVVASCERSELGQALNEALDDFDRAVHEARRRRRELRRMATPERLDDSR